MILTKEIKTRISHLNIVYYKKLGYNVKCNQDIIIPILDLPQESNKRIIVCCDFCNFEKEISYQKYNKNISSHNLYACSNICAVEKVKMTNLQRYGDRNYVNSELHKKNIKKKYDDITQEIEEYGSKNCSICLIEYDISQFKKNINGRYKGKCKTCRTNSSIKNRKIRIDNDPIGERLKERITKKLLSERNRERYNNYARLSYYRNKDKNKHKLLWRSVLSTYLKRKNIKKNDRTENLLGYSHIDLKIHIESLFDENMSWDNFNIKWQLDHIIPICLFRNDSPINIVNSLINLRPLDKFINLSRGLNNLDTVLLERFKTYLK